MKKGLIQIYTGNGKGKTTAAIGQAVRARGSGLKVCYISFFKDPERWGYAEFKMLKKLGIDVFHFAPEYPCFNKKVTDSEIRNECIKGMQFFENLCSGRIYATSLRDMVRLRSPSMQNPEWNRRKSRRYKKKTYDLVVADEILIGIRDGFIKEKELIKLLEKKPDNMEVILTGRKAAAKLIKKAGLVTEMKKIKHPYDKGIKGRKGIEY